MMLRGHKGTVFFFFAAVNLGVHLQRIIISVLPDPEIHPPKLQPSESVPPVGTYMLEHVGDPCIKATMGVEYTIIEEKNTWYFNLDPSRVRTRGYCSQQAAALSLSLTDNAAGLELTFAKENDVFYVTRLTASVSPLPVCQGCANKTYSGMMSDEKLFKAPTGRSFKCKSENLLLMSSELQIKLVPLQIQTFPLSTSGHYGAVLSSVSEVECWADYNKRVISVVLRVTVMGLILTAALAFLLIRNRQRPDPDRL